ncbi:MAG: hypothetical protein N3G79_01350 [Sulfolobales archaeon]|nr:hypothetical protein [Sulfolobales archaeon]
MRSFVNLGLKLENIDRGALLELSQLLGDLLLRHLNRVSRIAGVDFHVSIELELSETLDVVVDVFLASSTPIAPEVLAQIDREIDEALSEFEKVIALKYR